MYKDIIEVDFTNEFDQVISPGTEVIYFTTNVIWPRRGTYIGMKGARVVVVSDKNRRCMLNYNYIYELK